MSREIAQRSLAVLFSAVVTACGGGGSSTASVPTPPPPPPPPPPSAATEYIVNVQATDAAIDPQFGSHYAYINTSVTSKGRLFLFFGATDSVPQFYTLIETAAANAGLHSIGMAFPNGPDPVNISCSGSADPDCTSKIREETFAGTNTSSLVSVSASDSVQNRLVKVLTYLQAQHPTEGWGQYLGSGNSIRWDLIRVSGLSQGGGLAGYIAKQKAAVDRACFFSSPADWDDVGNQPAGWVLSGTRMTAASKIYGFNHLSDPVVPFAHIQQTWQAFGLDAFGAPVRVDQTSSFNGTHELTTDLGSTLSAHTSTASDSATPLDTSSLPVYRSAWQYACFN